MTAFRLPPLVVDYDTGLWLQADVRGTSGGGWVLVAVAQLMARPEFAAYRDRKGERKLRALLGQAAAIARERQEATLGFFLYPSPDEKIQGLAVFCPVDLGGQAGSGVHEDLVEQIAPQNPGAFPREVRPVETKAGPCRRIRQRYAEGDGPDRPLGERIVYLWVFEDYGAAVVLDISFPDVLQAARWLPALDLLAASVWLQQ